VPCDIRNGGGSASFADLQPEPLDEILRGGKDSKNSLSPEVNTNVLFEMMLQNVLFDVQPAFPGLRDAMKKKVTRREQFLAEMDAVVPWTRLAALIPPHYPKIGTKGGRPPMPLENAGQCGRRNQSTHPRPESWPWFSSAQFAKVQVHGIMEKSVETLLQAGCMLVERPYRS
jgi:hypothetical protein